MTGQIDRPGQPHAQSLVENDALKPLDGRFQNVGAGRAIERNRNLIAQGMHDKLVLGSCQRKPNALLPGQERSSWQRPENLCQPRTADGTIGILTFRQNSGKEPSAIIAAEVPPGKRQGL